MFQVGESLYGMRIVHTNDGNVKETSLFDDFEGIIFCHTWDAGEWQILLQCKDEQGEWTRQVLGVVDDRRYPACWSGRQMASYFKAKARKVIKTTSFNVYWDKRSFAIDSVLASSLQTRDEILGFIPSHK